MGHKVNPYGFRLGVTTQWTSNWYAERKTYGENLNKDIAVRNFLRTKLANASVSRVRIERPAKSARVIIHTARPGIVIGKKGEDIEKLRGEVAARMGLKPDAVHISVEEIRKPEVDSQLIAESIAQQLERRIMFRRAMKRAVQNAMRLGAGGIKVQVGGRLNGAEISRVEWYREGRVPLHTLRAYVDYGFAEAKTTYGVIGVKVWVFHGEQFEGDHGGPHGKKDESGAATEATA
ncbi:MAG: 30S ribosomal protein S3 [Gammaproteobacteria bacterium]|nr:30S ribosomal protein S3 [Gammaproteobacteria bacterium]